MYPSIINQKAPLSKALQCYSFVSNISSRGIKSRKWKIGVRHKINNNFKLILFSFLYFCSLEVEQIKLAAARDSWEDGDVADSWDAEEEEVKVEVKKVIEPVKKTPSKKAEHAIAPAMEEPIESEQARKKRMSRLIQESDLENAMALFGISKSEINIDEVLDIAKKDGI